jgi:hypothetical protein
MGLRARIFGARIRPAAAERAFTSDLHVGDLAARRAAGYEPVGQAFGSAVFHVVNLPALIPNGLHPGLAQWPPPSPVRVGSRVGNPAAWTTNTDKPLLVRGYFQATAGARTAALRRLDLEAQTLGADAVIGVRRVPAEPIPDYVEFTFCATAVRATRPARPAAYFATTLAAADVGNLLRGGWEPAGLLFEQARYTAHGGIVASVGGGRMNPSTYRPSRSHHRPRLPRREPPGSARHWVRGCAR